MLLDYIPDNSLGATSGTVYVYASGSVAPGQVQVSKSGTYANSVNVSVGSFSSYTGMAGYSWRAAISVSSNVSAGWPTGSNSVVSLVVKTSAGIIAGTVNVTLAAPSEWYFVPGTIGIWWSGSSHQANFSLYCLHSFSMGSLSYVNGWPGYVDVWMADYRGSNIPIYTNMCTICGYVNDFGINYNDYIEVYYGGARIGTISIDVHMT
jgi:hypothetical protein